MEHHGLLFSRGGLYQNPNLPSHTIRSTQIDPNEIRLDDIPEDENIEGQIAWEGGNFEPLEVVEEWANVALQAGSNQGELEPTKVGGLDGKTTY
jgi:hypothetical protein